MQNTEALQQEIEQLRAANQNYQSVITRLQFDFAVLDSAKEFPKPYIAAVVKDIMTLLPMEGVPADTVMAKKKKKKGEDDEE